MAWVFFLNNINTTIGLFVSKISFLVLIIGYILLGYTPDAETIFYLLNLFNQINSQFGLSLPLYFSRSVQLSASLQRLNKVLHADELQKSGQEFLREDKPCIILNNVSLTLGKSNILEQIVMKITRPGIHLIIGPVGSGKSSLLKIILQEYHPVSEGKN